MGAMDELEPELIANFYSDPWWRLNNLYSIVDENGKKIPFVPNEYQKQLYDNLWYNNVILKSRQLGFTTFITILLLDTCLFNSNHQLATIAHTLEDAEKIFRLKVRFAVQHLDPAVLAMAGGVSQMSASSVEFGNGSKFSVAVSARSGTLQGLHVSEYGKIAAKFPEKAREIKTGSFPAVHKGNFIFVESTAEGQEGDFYNLTMDAMAQHEQGQQLTESDFRFHFFPWWRDSKNRQSIELPLPKEMQVYFQDLKLNHGIVLEPEQKWWYAAKQKLYLDDMKREYPSYPKEAFEQAVVGSYYAPQMAWLRSNGHMVKNVALPNEKVHTFWDLGRNDMTAIWFMQEIAGEYRFIDYYEAAGEALDHYVKQLQTMGYLYGTHYLPHDANNVSLERGESRVDRLRELGLHNLEVVDRVEDVNVGIELVRSILPRCWFDVENCSSGLAHLDSYRKEWDDKAGTFKNKPRHDIHSNGADAFRQFAQGYRVSVKRKPIKRSGSWRTA